MDETLLAAASCAILAILVYLMWKEASKSHWQELTRKERERWGLEEK
jgi:hypothetical protein